jgi:hypothetical protein
LRSGSTTALAPKAAAERRIGDLIQQHDDVAVLQQTLTDDIAQIDLRQGGGVEHQTLMDGSGRKQAVEIGPLDQSRGGTLDFRGLGLLDHRGEAGERRFSRQQAMHAPFRIGPGRRDGMKPEQQAWTGGLR